MEREKKVQLLKEVERRMRQKHKPLSKSAENLVFGAGDPDADIMFIGEGPGEVEDKTGVPFTGKAGKFLTALLKKAGLSRDAAYLTNVVKYRPPRNRTPTDNEADKAAPFLRAQIKIVDPQVIVGVGRFASQRLSGSELRMGQLRKDWWPHDVSEGKVVPVKPIYHPGYVLRLDGDESKDVIRATVEALREAKDISESPDTTPTFAREHRASVDGDALNSALESVDVDSVEF